MYTVPHAATNTYVLCRFHIMTARFSTHCKQFENGEPKSTQFTNVLAFPCVYGSLHRLGPSVNNCVHRIRVWRANQLNKFALNMFMFGGAIAPIQVSRLDT